MQMPNLLSLLVPIAYLSILLGSLATFSYLYRRRQHSRTQNLAPYFPPHTARNVYLTLLHQTDHQQDLKQVPNSILCAALQERAIEDILRIREIQTRKGPLNTLLQRGVVGDEIWQRLLRAEQELEEELKDVVAEANALANEWGQTIFQSANEIAINRITKKKIEEKRKTLAEEKRLWEEKRQRARAELEGELDLTKQVEEKATELKRTTVQATSETTSKAAPPTVSSDEDAVMVETPATEVAPSTGSGLNTGSGEGKGKKKKGKR